jgi:hypothetical protein
VHTVLTVAGIAFDATGIVVAAVELRATWSRFGAPGSGMLDPLTQPIVSGLRQFANSVLRIVGVRRDAVAHTERAAIDVLALDDSASSKLVYGSLEGCTTQGGNCRARWTHSRPQSLR